MKAAPGGVKVSANSDLLRALVWLCLVLGLSVLVSQLIFIRLSWGLQGANLATVQLRMEVETLSREVDKTRIESREHRIQRCQMLLLMAASRSGWLRAQRLLKDNTLDVCVQQEEGAWESGKIVDSLIPN